MSAHAIVKSRTAAAHVAIDAAFSRFDLGDRSSYVGFLLTHARVLPAVEVALAKQRGLPPWRPRTPLLTRDLDAFGHGVPMPLEVTETSGSAEAHGLLYVIEGSRLGSRLLLRGVPPEFAAGYLSASHESGGWRRFTTALDERATAEDAAWLEGVVAGALRGFRLFALSAATAFAPSADPLIR